MHRILFYDILISVVRAIKKKIMILSAALFSILLVFAAAVLLYDNGVILLNHPSERDFPVRGVDVSSHQGDIDWAVLAGGDIDFCFIKATEGSSYVDPCFQENYSNALKTDLRVGAYHFFSFDSSGKTQADHFISAVPKTEGMLPPAVDFEFYGDKAKDPPDKKSTRAELTALLSRLEDHYGRKPIIYATEESYGRYLAYSYDEYDIWIRDVIHKPSLPDGRSWTFWQYTDKVVLNGYRGKEKFIDMNVFSGTKEAFGRY